MLLYTCTCGANGFLEIEKGKFFVREHKYFKIGHKLKLDDCLSHKAFRISQRQECTHTRTQWQALASVTTYTDYRPVVLTTITYMALHIKTIDEYYGLSQS